MKGEADCLIDLVADLVDQQGLGVGVGGRSLPGNGAEGCGYCMTCLASISRAPDAFETGSVYIFRDPVGLRNDEARINCPYPNGVLVVEDETRINSYPYSRGLAAMLMLRNKK